MLRYQTALVPWHHFIPLGESYESIFDMAQWLFENDDVGRRIAANGQAFAKSLNRASAHCYTSMLLNNYHALLSDPPAMLGSRAMLLESAIEKLWQDVHAFLDGTAVKSRHI